MAKQKNGLLEHLRKGVVLCAEGYVFELERRGYVTAGSYVPQVVLEHPDAVAELTKEFLLCGSDVVVALTYYADKKKMSSVKQSSSTEKLNKEAIRIAKKQADVFNALVAGNISNTWAYNSEKAEESTKKIKGIYSEQVSWAKQLGVDYVIAETLGYYAEAKIALEVIKSYGLPAVITFSALSNKTFDGVPLEEACKKLEEDGALVVGLNCAKGPMTMMPLLKKIRKTCKGYIAALPVAYRTNKTHQNMLGLEEKKKKVFPLGLDPFVATRFEMARFAKKAKKLGINYVGVCCGGAPHHVRAMAEALGKKTLASKHSPDLSKHPVLGKKKTNDQKLTKLWKK
ncbi:homocysteine S-methyltransferase family protein [Candidatus Woesearchaeota archaeon]|nr:homocysteine S-methyltransferase family protein [Candidatus Woesearchaeota archaeon]